VITGSKEGGPMTAVAVPITTAIINRINRREGYLPLL
jgi:hypothetical protein